MDLFWTVVVVLVILWLLGLIVGFGGVLINALVVIAVIIVVYRLFVGKNVLTGR
jgi:hypothetical protein